MIGNIECEYEVIMKNPRGFAPYVISAFVVFLLKILQVFILKNLGSHFDNKKHCIIRKRGLFSHCLIYPHAGTVIAVLFDN